MLIALPTTDQLTTMPIKDIARCVNVLRNEGPNIHGEAAMDVNRFLAEAAMRMAAYLDPKST